MTTHRKYFGSRTWQAKVSAAVISRECRKYSIQTLLEDLNGYFRVRTGGWLKPYANKKSALRCVMGAEREGLDVYGARLNTLLRGNGLTTLGTGQRILSRANGLSG